MNHETKKQRKGKYEENCETDFLLKSKTYRLGCMLLVQNRVAGGV